MRIQKQSEIVVESCQRELKSKNLSTTDQIEIMRIMENARRDAIIAYDDNRRFVQEETDKHRYMAEKYILGTVIFIGLTVWIGQKPS